MHCFFAAKLAVAESDVKPLLDNLDNLPACSPGEHTIDDNISHNTHVNASRCISCVIMLSPSFFAMFLLSFTQMILPVSTALLLLSPLLMKYTEWETPSKNIYSKKKGIVREFINEDTNY